MRITPQHAQMLMHAISMAAQVAGQRLSAETSRREMEIAAQRFEAELETKSGLLRDLIGALIEKRLEAVRSGFTEVLTLYADQARHYMSQQAAYADQELATQDALQSARLRKRMGEIDIELRHIRGAAQELYTQMNEIVMRLGGDGLVLNPEFCTAFALSMPRVVP